MTTVDHRYPKVIHGLWSRLDNETNWLHGRWIIYRQLFGTSEQRVGLLNDSARTFFWVVHDVLLHDIQLSLSKLGDPATTRGGKNMTLRALHDELLAAGEVAAADKLDVAIQKFQQACAKIRQRRNKWIAHFDRLTMLNEDKIPRMGPSRSEIEAAMKALREAMNTINVHYTDTTIAYECFSMQADGETLLHNLRRGLRYKELVASGTVPRSDYRKRFKGEF